MPDPVSRTLTSTAFDFVEAVTDTRPPSGVWRIAFEMRLVSTSRMRSGSTSTSGRSGPTLTSSELDALSGIWHQVWRAADVSAPPAARAGLAALPIR